MKIIDRVLELSVDQSVIELSIDRPVNNLMDDSVSYIDWNSFDFIELIDSEVDTVRYAFNIRFKGVEENYKSNSESYSIGNVSFLNTNNKYLIYKTDLFIDYFSKKMTSFINLKRGLIYPKNILISPGKVTVQISELAFLYRDLTWYIDNELLHEILNNDYMNINKLPEILMTSLPKPTRKLSYTFGIYDDRCYYFNINNYLYMIEYNKDDIIPSSGEVIFI